MALSRAPTPALLFKDPKIKQYFIGGQAVVLIANEDMNITALSQADLARAYGQTPQSTPENLTGLSMVVRNADGQGCERTFAGWLTGGQADSLEGYMAAPPGVQNCTAHGDAGVISKVAGTPGALGFVSWMSVGNNDPSVSHIKVIPIVNKNNQIIQAPSDNAVKGEMARMDNVNYDAGLIWGLYYLTEGTPRPLVQEYIDWCLSPKAVNQLHGMGMYRAADIEASIT